MATVTTDRTLIAADLFARAAKPALAAVYPPDSCINAACIAQRVFDVLGMKSQPLTVQVDVMNPPLVRFLNRFHAEHKRQPSEQEWTDAAAAIKGGHIIGLGYAQSPIPGQPYTERNRWAGHLVTILEGRVLIDITLDQADRPGSGIVLKPVVQEVLPAFLVGSGWLPTIHGRGDQTSMAVYKARPLDNTYRSAGAWKRWDTEDELITRNVLEEMTRGR